MLRAAPLALLLLVAACGGGPHDDIQGAWKPDFDAMEGTDKQNAVVIKQITITEDTFKVEAAMGGVAQVFRYTVVSEDGDTIVIELEHEGAKDQTTIEIDGDRLKVTGKGPTLVLKRA